MLTGWQFETDGKKRTMFDKPCKALGVEFDLSRSGERILVIKNTEQRVQDLKALVVSTLQAGTLGKNEALMLCGRLGFAESFLHGRLGSLVLKQLSEHAYGRSPKLQRELIFSVLYDAPLGQENPEWYQQTFVSMVCLQYTDAAYEPATKSGGLGAALFNEKGACSGWFGVRLNMEQYVLFGAEEKQTIIYELELLASVLALDSWASSMNSGLQVCFGDNDGARFSLIRGSCLSRSAAWPMKYHLLREAENNLCTWFAKAPTEANIADYPSRNTPHPLLEQKMDESAAASIWFDNLVNSLKLEPAEQSRECRQPGPTWKKTLATACITCGQRVRPDDAADLDHQVVLTIVFRNSLISGHMSFHPRLWLKGGCGGSVVKFDPKAPTHNHSLLKFHRPNRQPCADSLVPLEKRSSCNCLHYMWPTRETRRCSWSWSSSCLDDCV